jgi:hypothetical protein
MGHKGHGNTTKASALRAILGTCATAFFLLAFAAPAFATNEHVFDPTLSLRGDCTTNALDEVPDPGVCPGTAGVDHPPKKFDVPCGPATDPHGDIYVSSAAINGAGTAGRIDVFNPKGEYLTEILDKKQPCSIAVDSKGNLYVAEYTEKNVVRFTPKTYPPTKGTGYEPPVIAHEVVETNACLQGWSVAVDPSNDHLYIGLSCSIVELASAAEGNVLVKKDIGIGLSGNSPFNGVGVDGATHNVYATIEALDHTLHVVVLDGSDHHLVCEIDGSETPDGGFGSTTAGLGVDQSNGDVYVDDVGIHETVDQFNSACHYIGQLKHSFKPEPSAINDAGIAIDSPMPGQVGYDSPNKGEVYIAGGENSATFHLYAFAPLLPAKASEVEFQASADVTETEAVLEAKVNPSGVDTTYHFEYTTQKDFELNGYAGEDAVSTPELDAGSGASFKAVSEPISGLEPGTAYRFRLVASNHCNDAEPLELCTTTGEGKPGEVGEDSSFSTYAPEAELTEQRGYELVTPPDTGGRTPTMGELSFNNPDGFDTPMISPDGQSVVFGIEGGSLSGIGEGGGYHDTYEAIRGENGWQTSFTGLSPTQSDEPYPGGVSAYHGYSFWEVSDNRGSLAQGQYLRAADGGIEPIGIGSLGEDLNATGRWISPTGEHIVFATEIRAESPTTIQLEPNAPSDGIGAVYERSPDGPTHVVSLPPEGASLATEEEFKTRDAVYQGASVDGTTVAFKINGSLYVRLDNTETEEVASGNTSFGGASRHGERIVYLRPNPTEPNLPNPIEPLATDVPQGDIFSYDTQTEGTKQIGSGEESIIVNVSPDGSHVYFVSPQQLDGGKGVPEAENLYVWDTASEVVRFISTLTDRDVFGEPAKGISATMTDGLGLWVQRAVHPHRSQYSGPGSDPSRTSADGTVLLFESRAQLTSYHNDGHSEVYRYDASVEPGDELDCLSCNPTGVAAESDAVLQAPPSGEFFSVPPTNDLSELINLSPDGRRAFFQSGDQLVVGDVDGKIDVYEWLAQGTGGCQESTGCIHLISSGRSSQNDYLYGMTPDGSDVIFSSADLLVPQDQDNTPSLYDARVGGGFPASAPPPGECLGEACQPTAVAPDDPTPGSSSFEGSGNVHEESPSGLRCPKGKHKVKARGKVHCVKRRPKAHHRRNHRANANRRTAR